MAADLIRKLSLWIFLLVILSSHLAQCQNYSNVEEGNTDDVDVTFDSLASPTASDSNKPSSKCDVRLQDEKFLEYIERLEREMRIVLFEFHLKTANVSMENDSLYNDVSKNFKPYLWYRTKTRHGRTLLMLSFHYDVLSMSILTIGVEKMNVNVTESPRGCLAEMEPDERNNVIRKVLLGNTKSGGEDRLSTERRDYICNQQILEDNGYGDFEFKCCYRDSQGEVRCSNEGVGLWITILYISVTAVKVLVFCFCPMFLPANMYSAMYVAAEYVVKLKKEVKKTIYISEESDYKIKYKQRMTIEDIADWWRFRAIVDELPQNEVLPMKMSEIRITVKGKRIIPENDPPTGLMRTFYDNLCRCKIKGIDPFIDCCDLSVYSHLEPKCQNKLTWHQLVQALVKALMLFMVPIPYYVRLFIYYNYEEEEMNARRASLDKLGLELKYNFYRTNIIQHYTPVHAVFIASYFFYFLAGLVIGFSSPVVRDRLKSVSRGALQDMNSISQTGVLKVIIRIGLWPFKKCGLLAILLGPLYACITAPFCVIILGLYCIPTIYLSFRIIYQTKRQIGNDSYIDEQEIKTRRKFKRIHKFGKQLSKMDKVVHRASQEEDESCCPSTWDWHGFSSIKNMGLQFLCAVFCLCVLYAIALIFAESFGLIVEMLAFTMMGIIVNASSTLKYVSMVLLVFVYMHDCYNNVYQNYLEFNKVIIQEMIDRAEDLKKIASLPSSMQENAAFQLKCSEEVPEIKTDLNFTKRDVRWRVGQLLLFLDSFDTPRIPLRLFQKLCDVQIHGAPGPVYLNLLRATGKFLVIVVFLLFVMIVVMAFGNVTQMSSTNQTLATLAGGFVPMLLKNVLSSKSIKLNLKTISFKGQIDEIIGEYKQYWPVKDLVLTRDLPEEEDDDEEKDGDKDKGGDKGKDNGKDKDKADKNGKDKKEDKDKSDMESKKDDKKEDKDKNDNSAVNLNSSKKGDAIEKTEDGITIINPTALNTEVDPEVDLFIDLSSADAPGGWSYRGSSESLPSDSMMPAYFTTNIQITYPEPEPFPTADANPV